MTKQRAAILQVLRSDKCHHTADEIFALSREIYPGISRATVYNNLKALEEEQIIRRIGGEGASARYDSSYIPHGHLFCTSCGRIYDFTIPDFMKTLATYSDSIVSSYELRINGVCEKCKKNIDNTIKTN